MSCYINNINVIYIFVFYIFVKYGLKLKNAFSKHLLSIFYKICRSFV